MEIPVSLPLDSDGFLRRECPHCVGQFKWHHGPANAEAEDQPSPDVYYCPLCGQPAELGEWATAEQVEYMRGVAMPQALQSLDEQLGDLFKGVSSKNFKVTQTGHLDMPDEPDPLTEPDDMTIVTSPCHAWEPVKVPDDHGDVLHCLVCGQAFAV